MGRHNTQMRWADSPILITGFPRSGTAWLAGVIASCGAFGGKWVGRALEDGVGNRMEHLVIQKRVVEECLRVRQLQSGFSNLPSPEAFARSPTLRPSVIWGQVQAILANDNYDSSKGPWFYKDSRLVTCWPEWESAFRGAHWFLAYRDLDSIADALVKTGHIFKDEGEASGWVDSFSDLAEGLAKYGHHVWQIDMDAAIGGNLTEVRKAVEMAGLPWNAPRVNQWIFNRRKHHHEHSQDRLHQGAGDHRS